MNKILLLLGFLATVPSIAQDDFDIITVFNYNILNYRNSTGQCNGNTNNTGDKEDALKVIIKHADPDLIFLQELGNNPVNLDRVLTNVLNTDGESRFNFTGYQATSFSSLMNGTFYNTEKFELYKQEAIEKNLDNTNIVRLIDVVTFYYKDPVLDQTLDTTFLTVFVAHLKAGNTTSDRNDRAKATASIMDYIDNRPEIVNFMIAGDLNVYSGSTADFDNLVSSNTADRRFYDPVNEIGNWNNNASYRFVHTQSTRSSQTSGGCFSGGGMDDRFDMVLISQSIKDDNQRVEYISSSYKALGQDGNRFNQTVSFPANNSAPANVIDALYDASDHLPVLLDLKISYSAPLGVDNLESEHEFKTYFVEDQLHIQHVSNIVFEGQLWITDLTGRTVSQKPLYLNAQDNVMINTDLPAGLYFITLRNLAGKPHSQRALKN